MFCLHGFSQNDSTFEHRLEDILSHQFPAESVHLHLDKTIYSSGDTIYFKAYVLNRARHQPSSLSGVLYLDLIDDHHRLVNAIKLQIVDGLAWGDFALPDVLPTGHYHIRAYTNYMKNQPDQFFEQMIDIRSAKSGADPVHESSGNKQKPAISFFPEGGQLVAGLQTKIGFNACYSDGHGLDASGIVIDNRGSEIAKFHTSHGGMGMFFLKPEPGKSYSARVTFSDGSQINYELPAVKLKGLVLSGRDSLGDLKLIIRSDDLYFEENKNKQLHLVLYSGGFSRSIAIVLNNKTNEINIPKTKFNIGIALACILSDSLQLISQRQFFISNSDLLNLTVKSDHTIYKKGEKAQITVNTKLQSENIAEVHLSAAVSNENASKPVEDREQNILTGALLGTDFRDDIEQAGYYFSGAKDASAALDLLMLTRGANLLPWNDFIKNSFKPIQYQPEKALTISGSVKEKTGLPYAYKDFFLLVIPRGNMLSTKTDEKGRFKFENLDFEDGTHFILQPSGPVKSQAPLLITWVKDELWPIGDDRFAKSTVDSIKLLNIEPDSQQKLKTSKVAYLDGTTVKNYEKLKPADQKHTSNADQVIRGEEINNAPNLSSALSGLLRGVDFVRKRGIPYLQGLNEPITIVVDGTVMDGAGINQLNPNSIALIELFKGANAGIYNANTGGGAMVITTKSQEQRSITNSLSSGALQINPRGFYKGHLFKPANYKALSTMENGNCSPATVYWNPDLVTDKNGNTSFSFNTPAIAGNYRIVIEGIDQKGNLGHQVYYFSVE